MNNHYMLGLSWWLSGKESTCQCGRRGFHPWSIKSSGEGNGNLPGADERHSIRDKGHEEGGSAYAKAGSSLRSPPGYS